MDQAWAVRFANRWRATSAAAAAPNSNIIGGAGTGVGGPPFDPLLPEEEAELAEDAEDALLALDPVLPEAPLADDPLALEPLALDPFDDQPPFEDHPPLDDQPLLLDP